jgi:hypothetical protein
MPEIWLEPDELNALQDVFDWDERIDRPLDWAAYDRAKARIVAVRRALAIPAAAALHSGVRVGQCMSADEHVPHPIISRQLGHGETTMTAQARRQNQKSATDSNELNHSANVAAAADAVYERIARRAYDLYLMRGGEPGHDLEDWLRAEGELKDPARILVEVP